MNTSFPAPLFIVLLFSLSGGWAANTPASLAAQPDISAPLRQTVAELAEREKRPAGDYARMAEETISFGSNPEAVNQLKDKIPDAADPHAPWRNMVQDALAGVDEGERRDAKAANWPELREKLKKLQPPPPPPSQGGSSKDKKDQKKDGKKDKKQKGSGKDKQQQSGEGQKGDQKDGGEGKEGEGESQGPPSQGKPGKGNKKGGQEEGGSEGAGKSEEGKSQNNEGNAKDREAGAKPGHEDGQGQEVATMDQPGRGETAGFEKFGSRESKRGTGKGIEAKNNSPPGADNDVAMRNVGGGTGKKEEAFGFGEPDPQSVSRLLQVKQADSPAVLQQNLNPEEFQPKPSSPSKPW